MRNIKSAGHQAHPIRNIIPALGVAALAAGFNAEARTDSLPQPSIAISANTPPTELHQVRNVNWSEFVDMAHNVEFRSVYIRGNEVTGIKYNDQSIVTSYGPSPDAAYNEIKGYAANINFEKAEQAPIQVTLSSPPEPEKSFWEKYGGLLSFAGIGGLVGLMVVNSLKKANHEKSRIRRFEPSKIAAHANGVSRTRFADVAGCDEAKEDMEEIVEFLKNPDKFTKLGGRIPKGFLLEGPSGTGKTLLAKAVAGEAHVPFFPISGSEFVEVYVGVGAQRVRELFEEAKENAPSIIFIDEIDAIAKRRGGRSSGANDEREQTLNQLLIEMDGFEGNNGVMVIAATNRKDVLDPAVLRAGRFDRHITVGVPDVGGREQILKVHTRGKPLEKDIDLKEWARATPGFSGADLENLVNEAAIFAARSNHERITQKDFSDARDKIMMGPERKSAILSYAERENTSFHESGHVIMLMHEIHADPLHKVTIMPRGGALGMAMWLPEEGGVQGTRAQLIAKIRVAMGGRAAEEIIYGKDHVTGGASGDIEMATNIARHMVTKFGMSEKLGNVNYTSESPLHDGFVAAAAEKIQDEIKSIIDEAYKYTLDVLSHEPNNQALHTLAAELLKKETMDASEVKDLITVETLPDSKEKMSARPEPFGKAPA